MLCYVSSNKNGAISSAVKCWILGDTTLYKCVIYDASWRNARSFLIGIWVYIMALLEYLFPKSSRHLPDAPYFTICQVYRKLTLLHTCL